MSLLLPIFILVSLTFALAAIGTGAQALLDPVGFSRSFGLPIASTSAVSPDKITDSYVSLMGIRQFATGIILLTFAYQGKWAEMATVLSIIGVVVAGVDGLHLWRAGEKGLARFHAIPGVAIAALAAATIFTIS